MEFSRQKDQENNDNNSSSGSSLEKNLQLQADKFKPGSSDKSDKEYAL